MKVLEGAMLLLLTVLAATCGGPRQDEAAVAVDTAAQAAAMLTPELFDSISWPSDSAAIGRGAVVWTYSCRKCHGTDGSGNGGFVQAGDTVRPPSLLEVDWRFANDREGMRRQIFTGTDEGMPHWGPAGLKPRDIDAVTVYVSRILRPQW
ncbi:hypothetical protein BH23GEM9_BH23GEM9_31270 [soil metagenome]